MYIKNPLSVYIHIPWCVKKCPYCDFNSHLYKNNLPEESYVNHLLLDLKREIDILDKEYIVKTIFIGGGTPSLFKPSFIHKIIKGVKEHLLVDDNVEITLEANPGASEASKFKGFLDAGVNRLSIGVQSLSDMRLKNIGRIHDALTAYNAVKEASNLDFNSINVDIMHGLPKQTLKESLDDLYKITNLPIEHISWYQLTIEPNTAFANMPLKLPSDDVLFDIWKKGHDILLNAGYKQYEISAYCHVGYECLHNLNYWRYGDYIGIGCGAHGKVTNKKGDIIRRAKVRLPAYYMQGNYLQKEWIVEEKDRPFEFFLNRFRLIEPSYKEEFLAKTMLKEEVIKDSINKALKKGYLEETSTYWKTTELGRRFLNDLLILFLA